MAGVFIDSPGSLVEKGSGKLIHLDNITKTDEN